MSKLYIIHPNFLFLVKDLCADFSNSPANTTSKPVCTVQPSSIGGNDAPTIIVAFHKCGHNGKVVFMNHTYHIKTVINSTVLPNCHVELHWILLVHIAIQSQEPYRNQDWYRLILYQWSTNTSYWLQNSLPKSYQNQSSVWFFGVSNVKFDDFGYGAFGENGQVRYDLVNGVSNYPHRPHALTIWRTRDSIFNAFVLFKARCGTLKTKGL
jgi:galacturan 1,4-alpha-galacturonidase